MDNEDIKKISEEEFKKTMTSFFVDQEFEKVEEEKRKQMVRKIKKELKDIDTREGLERYIRNHSDALQNLIRVLGVSQERFRRTVSMIRRLNKDYFKSEWQIYTIRNKMIKESKYMGLICELFLNGNEIYKDKIPKYILEQLVIDSKKLKMLTTQYAIEQYIRPSFEGIYSNDVGDKIEAILEEKIDSWTQEYGITYEHEKNISWISRNIDFIIPSKENPKVLIEVSYMVTTGSGQTTKQRDERDTFLTIEKYNDDNDTDIKFVSFIDGAGWLGRQKDLKKLFKHCHYAINLHNINDLKQIIKRYAVEKE